MTQDRICSSCGEVNPGRAKFCMECGEKFASSGADPSGERRTVTVLFADLSGFTAYSERTDVEDVRALAAEAADGLGRIVEKYGGYVDKIIGDCVMAVFGAPTAHEDDAERGVRAALDMRTYATDNAERFANLALTIGLNTGEVIWAPVGPGRYTVLGDTVNTAARLQSAAAKHEILIGQPTADETKDAIELEEVPPVHAKNKEEPVRAWRALRVAGSRDAKRAPRAKLAGRAPELARLRELWDFTRVTKRPHLVSLIGPAGIGKTRIVDELLKGVPDTTVVLRGRCLPYGDGITYWPVIEMIESAAGITHNDDTSEISLKLGALLEGLGSEDVDELRTMAVALAHLVGAPTTPRGTYSATEISRGELHWGLRRILELAARNTDIVLCFEDMQWAEPTLLELLEHVLASSADAPLFTIAAGRRDYDDSLISHENHRRLEVGALSDDDAAAIVDELLTGRDISDEQRRALLRQSGGNPLFLEEMAQMWSDTGAFEVPSGLHGVVAARLDRLPEAERRTIARASVIGNVFWSGAIGADEADLISLEERDVIRRRSDSSVTDAVEYEFKNGLLRDVAYDRIPKTERSALHIACAEWISALRDGADDLLEVVAYHYEQACLAARDVTSSAPPPRVHAADALKRAGEKAEAHDGTREADRFYLRALDVLGDGLPETGADLRLRRARTASKIGELEAAADELRSVVDLAGQVGRPDIACRALVNLADIELTIGRVSEAEATLAKAEALVPSLDDPRHQIRAAFVRAVIATYVGGDADAALVALQNASDIAEELGDNELELAAHLRLGVHHYNMGDLDAAEHEFTRASKLAAERGSLVYQAFASRFLGTIGYQRGPRAEAEDLALQVFDWLDRIGDTTTQSEVLQLLALFALARGDVETAAARLRDAQRLAGDAHGTGVEVGRYLAQAYWKLGRPRQAKRAAEAARAAAPPDDPQALAMAFVAEGFAAAAGGSSGDAVNAFESALGLLDDPGLVVDLAEVRLAYGRVLRALGEAEQGADQLEQARATFEAMGALATVAEIEDELVTV